MLFITFIFGVLILVLFALYERFSRAGQLIKKIPGPAAWPIVGNSLHIALPPNKLFYFLRHITKKYGHVNQIHGAAVRIVTISDPDDFEKVLSSPEYNLKQDPYSFITPWLAQGLLVSNGSKWQQRRKMLTKAFHFKVLKKFSETMKSGTVDFIERVEKETTKEQTDILAFICPTALRILCETTMGLSLGEDSPAMKKYFKSIFSIGEYFALRMSKAWLHNKFLFNLSDTAKSQKRLLADLQEFTTTVINDRRKSLDNRSVKQLNDNSEDYEDTEKLAMLDLLLENEKYQLINAEGIREEVDTFMFAGFDTTSITLSFLIMALANEAEVQDKIYEEMQSIFGDSQRMPTTEDLNEMKYLENCIKESLRLYPPAPLIARHLVNDTVLGGYTVPANTDCYLFIYDMHHRADIYPDPERFDPDRFLPENSLKRNPYSYVPFSAGQRNCIGQKFAMLEIKIAISSLLRKFRLEPVTKPSDLEFKFDLVLRTQKPMYVKFRSRVK